MLHNIDIRENNISVMVSGELSSMISIILDLRYTRVKSLLTLDIQKRVCGCVDCVVWLCIIVDCVLFYVGHCVDAGQISISCFITSSRKEKFTLFIIHDIK